MDMWMHTSEYRWLHDYVEKLHTRAVRRLIDDDGTSSAWERGYIRACEEILLAPERYTREMQAREAEELNV